MMRGGGNVVRGFGHGFMTHGYNGWMGLLPIAFHLVFFVIIVLLAIIFLRRHGKRVRKLRKLNDPALLTLRQRYALGEIDTEEFNLRNKDLSN